MGIALHGYMGEYGKLPAAGRGYSWCSSTATGNGDTEVYNSNGLVLLLPYLEQEAVFRLFNLREASAVAPSGTTYWRNLRATEPTAQVGNPLTNGNAAAATTVVRAYLCPIDASAPPVGRLGGNPYYPGAGVSAAATNYDFVVNYRSFNICNHWRTAATTEKYLFGENSSVTPSSVPDGLSNTLAIGETTRWHQNGAAFAWAYRTWVMTGIDPGHPSNPGINLWHLPSVDPTWQSPPYAPRIGRTRTWWAAAASMHSGGANFCFGDGSVRFLSETIDAPTLRALSTMANGDVANLP